VRARGTTLGADNGLGVAAILAVLASNDLSHPPIEAQ
jgi:dipeptidase D